MHLQLQHERERGEKGKRQEYGREHNYAAHACAEAQQVRSRVRMQPYYRIHYRCRHDEPVGNALFQKPMHVAFTKWFVPSPMNSPFHCSKTAKLREPPVQTGHLSPSLLDSSVTVTFGLQLFVFMHDFPLERSFSLCFSFTVGSSSSFFFCRACMCCRAEFAGPTKK